MRPLVDWLSSKSIETGSRIVLAADVTGPYKDRVRKASSLVRRLSGRIVAVKVNVHLVLPYGVLGLRELAEECGGADIPLIADIKLNDIGATNVEAAQTLFSNGFDALIANPFVGYKEAMGDLIAKTRAMKKAILLLVYMSHLGAREGYGLKVGGGEPLYLRFADRVRRWGADGAVVSAKSPAVLREVRSMLRERQLILSPGVGFQGGDARKAIAAGTDYIIVGRSIIGAEDPERAAETFNRQLAQRGAERT